MKKVAAGIITVICAVCFFSNSNASPGKAVNSAQEDYGFVQDTNPRPQRDSMKWNKKKYKDSTGRSRKDTLQLHK